MGKGKVRFAWQETTRETAAALDALRHELDTTLKDRAEVYAELLRAQQLLISGVQTNPTGWSVTKQGGGGMDARELLNRIRGFPWGEIENLCADVARYLADAKEAPSVVSLFGTSLFYLRKDKVRVVEALVALVTSDASSAE